MQNKFELIDKLAKFVPQAVVAKMNYESIQLLIPFQLLALFVF